VGIPPAGPRDAVGRGSALAAPVVANRTVAKAYVNDVANRLS
jgi:hypothetical protein